VIEIKGLLHQVVQLGTITGDSNIIGTRVLVQAGKMISTGCSVESGVTVTRNIPEKAIVI
jgi:acetyltransferase-like isoleucine patch superfamily enzyme